MLRNLSQRGIEPNPNSTEVWNFGGQQGHQKLPAAGVVKKGVKVMGYYLRKAGKATKRRDSTADNLCFHRSFHAHRAPL
jgi:hypothetical protein